MARERTYSDFDLVIERTGDVGYHARVVDSPVGTADGSFTLPFSDMELENFMLKVGRPRRGTRRLESPEMGAAREFGTQLFGAVFHDDLRLSLRRSLDEVERRGEGLRIRLRLGDTPELATLPWEFLFSEPNDQFLVLSAWTPIVRYLDLAQPIEPLTVTGPLRILVMISSPRDYPTLDVEEEWSRIATALVPLIESGAVTVDRTDDATLLELQRILRKNEYHIFHFLGHGGFDEQADDGVLVLEDGQNRSRLVSGRDLGTILHDHRSLRLAVLNACEGARTSESDPFSGAAQSLVRQGIPAVVAMQFEITDEAAIAFAQEFYAATADGLPVDASVAEARRAIFSLGNDIEWGTPVLYLRTDGRLFEVDTDVGPGRVPAAAPAAPTSETEIEEVEDSEPEEDVETPPRPSVGEAIAGAAVVVAATGQAPSVAGPEEIEVGAASASPPPEAEQTTPAPATTAPSTAAAPPDADGSHGSLAAPGSALRRRRLGLLPVWGWMAAVFGLIVVLFGVSAFLSRDDTGQSPDTQTSLAPDTQTSLAPDDQTSTITKAPPTTVIAAEGTATALRTTQPKVIDGIADDWTEPVFHTTDNVIYTHPLIVDDRVPRAGEENDSLIRLAWDETYLYVYADVDDDMLSAPNTGNQIWRNDAVNLNISVANGTRSERPDADDHQLTLSPGDPVAATTASAVRFVGDGTMFNDNFTTGVADIVSITSPDGSYVLEARLPWSNIGISDPQPGHRFGLLVTVFDNDGERFEGKWLQAEIKANIAGAEFQRPQTWGTLTLEG